MSANRKKIYNVDDDDSQCDTNNGAVVVKFFADGDCEPLFLNPVDHTTHGQGPMHGNSSECTPKHNRVTSLRGETPPSRTGPRRSCRIPFPDTLQEEEEDEEDVEKLEPLKPTALFLDTNDSPTAAHLPSSKKNKERMLQKAKESREKYSSPKQSEEITPQKRPKYELSTSNSKQKTPQSKQSTNKMKIPKTPRIQQQNIKANLKIIMECSDESDWNEESDSDSDTGTDGDESDTSTAPPPTPKLVTPTKICSPKPTPNLGMRTRNRTTRSAYKSEDYFSMNSGSKVTTSDKTLSMLENPRLNADTVQQTLKQVANKHQQEVESLLSACIDKFDHWMCLLHEGFNMILHGFGSKISLLEKFHAQMLRSKYDSIVINGFFTGLTLRDILKSIAEDIAQMTSVVGDEGEICDMLVSWYNNSHASPLFLLVNSIDCGVFQSNKAQNILSRLAATKNIHLIATIDHASAALLFDQSQLSRYNFVWQDATNFLPYTEEISFETSLLVQQSGVLALASLGSVFQSLTSNARSIYLLVMNRQIETTDPKYMGMPFSELYRESREQFIVSSDGNLRSHLTEFHDHKLMTTKKGSDGAELLYIPIPRATLLEFKNTQEE